MSYTSEVIIRVYNDDSGDYYEIAPDSDGLGLIELRAYDNNGKRKPNDFIFDAQAAKLVGEALLKQANLVSNVVTISDNEGS